MYQLSGEARLDRWFAAQGSAEQRAAMLDFLRRLTDDPYAAATIFLRERGVPSCSALVPGTSAVVNYAVIEQYTTILVQVVTDHQMDRTF